MTVDKLKYDVAIIGAGLAGLSLSIQLSRKGYSVILFEKEKFPFHKVCGEYISLESWDFLKSLGLPLEELNLPIIKSLMLTSPNGKTLQTELPLGGFGISRYFLDAALADIAKNSGVTLIEETKVEGIEFDDEFKIQFNRINDSAKQTVKANICCAAYGKKSNLDVKWNRSFLQLKDSRLDNYVGIKYHVQANWKENVIGLHNFENGYCGISKIEDDRYCLCYMTRAGNLKKYKGSIHDMEREILFKNKHLKKIFSECKIIDSFPISISQINFNKKTVVENNVLMLGDAAGTITPLCGNGMSLALHSSKILAGFIVQFLSGTIDRDQLEMGYEQEWNKTFSKRLRTGRILQRFFGGSTLTNLFVQTFKMFPFLVQSIIKKTHGRPF